MNKKCPYCDEKISEDAKKCKHCGEWLDKKKKMTFFKIYLIWVISIIVFFASFAFSTAGRVPKIDTICLVFVGLSAIIGTVAFGKLLWIHKFELTNQLKRIGLIILTILVFFIVILSESPFIADDLTETIEATKIQNSDLEEFPPLDLPLDYFDEKNESMSSGLYHIFNDEMPYQSYPTTTISLSPDLYSNTQEPLPPIKSDIEIHEVDPNFDWMGHTKSENIKKYGELARRFVGVAGDGLTIYSVKEVQVEKDGISDTLVSLSLTGANVLGTQDILIRGNRIVFSSKLDAHSTLTPAKNGNGFFLQWYDNFKGWDGYVTTRFVFDGEKFVPVYEQKTRYIRIKQ